MHEVQTMAYLGAKPWHGLGRELATHQSIETWKDQARMNWSIKHSYVKYEDEGSAVPYSFPEHRVLYPPVTKEPLALVSKRYQIVQSGEILEFYRDLTDIGGFELETAGVLRRGRKFWALARTGQEVDLPGGDRVNGYLLLATACDDTLATTAQFT